MHTYAAYACQVYTFKTFQNKDRTKINKANHCRDKHSHTVAIRQIFQLQNALHWLFNDFVKTEFQLLLLSIVFRVLLCPFLLSHLLLQTCTQQLGAFQHRVDWRWHRLFGETLVEAGRNLCPTQRSQGVLSSKIDSTPIHQANKSYIGWYRTTCYSEIMSTKD